MFFDIIGALVYGFAVWNLVLFAVDRITKKNELTLLIVSLIVCMAFTLVVGFLWYPLAFVLHVPAVLLFFIYDLIKYKKSPSESFRRGI